MKKIRGGKRYNTETATKIAKWANHHHRNNWHYLSEVLYRTESGNWFIAGKGGALTRYAKKLISGRTHGAEIVPLTQDEAYEWMMQHGLAKLLESHFSDQITDS